MNCVCIRRKRSSVIRRLLANKDAILADAQDESRRYDRGSAQVQTNELVSEHEIMQQAYAQANEIVTAGN